MLPRNLLTQMERRQNFIGGTSDNRSTMKDSHISTLSKSNRVKTVEGRSRNPNINQRRNYMMKEMAMYEESR